MEIQQLITSNGWVSAEGSWGIGTIAVFDESLLNDQQWNRLDELRDSEKYDYVLAILNNEDLSEWEDSDEEED